MISYLIWPLYLSNSHSYFVTLISKEDSSALLGDLRLVSWSVCLYKLLAKVLASKFSLVVDKIFFPSQCAFIKRSLLVDGVMSINEILDWAKKTKNVDLIWKMDFKKAYD